MSLLRNIGVGQTKLINDWLKKHTSVLNGIYKINEDFTVDVDGDVIIEGSVPEFPEYICFGVVNGFFYIPCGSNITSLRGCPRYVGGDFDISYNSKLTSLNGCPDIVDGNFNCRGCNYLTSLVGCPRSVGHNFFAETRGSKFPISYIKSICNVEGEILN